MVKWPWSRKPPRKLEKGPYFACPKCRTRASKKNLDRALTQASDLTCENCRETNPKYSWEIAGLTESGVATRAAEAFTRSVKGFTGRVSAWVKRHN